MKELKLKAYVDGSFNIATSSYGAGVVMLDENDKVLSTISTGGSDGDWVQMRNVAGEIYAAMLAVKSAVYSGATELTIYCDYEGIHYFANRRWKARNPATAAYVLFMDSAAKTIKISFRSTRAHTGIYYNEMADALAKNGAKGV